LAPIAALFFPETIKAVEQQLLGRHYVLLRANRTRYDPEITAALRRVGRSGVPNYVVFLGTGGSSPNVLPELLTRGVALNVIWQTGSQRDNGRAQFHPIWG